MSVNNMILLEKIPHQQEIDPNMEIDVNGYSKYFIKAIELKLQKDKFIEPPSQQIEDIMQWLND